MPLRSNVFDRVLVAGFTLLLFTPLLVQVFVYSSQREDVLQENRVLARLPSLPRRFSDVLSYPGKFEDYYKDNFGLRAPLLAISTTLKLATGVTANSVSLSGKDSWIFLNRLTLAQRLQKTPPLTDNELALFATGMNNVDSRLGSKGITFVHFAAPEKESIYPEYLPPHINLEGPTPLDQINEAMAGSGAYIDVKKALLEEKARRPDRILYHEIDTHWNCWGAYLGYRAVVNEGLIQRGATVPVVGDAEFVFRDVSQFDKRNPISAHFWLSSIPQKDTAFECLLDKSPLVELHLQRPPHGDEDMPNINGESTIPDAAFISSDVMFKPWKSSDRRGESTLKAIFIRDSFASRLAPYFSRSFSEVIYIHREMLGLAKLGRLIDVFDPDVVIYEYAERNLDAPAEQVLAPLVDSLER
jgi:alginate O-acetyltransferase complex protein AlgJ